MIGCSLVDHNNSFEGVEAMQKLFHVLFVFLELIRIGGPDLMNINGMGSHFGNFLTFWDGIYKFEKELGDFCSFGCLVIRRKALFVTGVIGVTIYSFTNLFISCHEIEMSS